MLHAPSGSMGRMNQAMSDATGAPEITDLGHDVFQIDTKMAGYDGITAGYLIRGSRPCLVETGTAPSAPVVRSALDARSAWGPRTWPRSWSPTSTWTMPAAPGTWPGSIRARRSWCTSAAPGTWPTRPG